jgi:hypothetical protein
MTMQIDLMRHLRPLWQGEGAGGAAAAALTASADPAPVAPAGQAAPAAAPAGDPAPAAAPAAPAAKWWETDRFTPDQRKHLTASGLTVDDPTEALARITDMHRHAVQRIGKDPATILDKPGKDQPLADWMKANKDLFGIPEKPEDYKIERPKEWPKDAQWDADFEAQARAFAHEHAIPPGAMQGLVGLYAQKVAALNGKAEADLAAANATMMADLGREWGPQADARMLRAGQAAQTLAERAGMTADQIADVAKALSPKVGDANVIKLFDVIAQGLGDDALLGAGKGTQGFGMTPAEARQRNAQMRAPGGEYYEAVQKGDSRKMAELKPEMERLAKIAAGGEA